MLAEQHSIGCEHVSQLLQNNTLLLGQNRCSYGRHFVVNEELLCSNLRALVFGNGVSTGCALLHPLTRSQLRSIWARTAAFTLSKEFFTLTSAALNNFLTVLTVASQHPSLEPLSQAKQQWGFALL